ncbi:MAG: WGR domain-containing protein [Mesorhizobium sp.]|uniref:WGR domain-containing protein n=1 Tax=Mesorhizobium sp. TaxID=1871066 RepID=UPI000FE6E2D5|nr:WGR domain-containing protein [Mesorhizobium sp.]RWO93347.1 MAG: WGR domain-containing protein [Mesorhizobium sp.]
MHNIDGEAVHLQRIDPNCNMARFYALSVQPTLFGEVSLIRNWGRIGTSGQSKVETFFAKADMDIAFARLERVKRRRGYVDRCSEA